MATLGYSEAAGRNFYDAFKLSDIGKLHDDYAIGIWSLRSALVTSACHTTLVATFGACESHRSEGRADPGEDSAATRKSCRFNSVLNQI